MIFLKELVALLIDNLGFCKAAKLQIKIAITNPITPPSLFGTARKIAYANKKYHSGLM